MAKWIKVQTSTGDQLLLASEVVSVRRISKTVTFTTKHNGIFTWDWEGTTSEWASLISGLELDNAV